MKAGGPATTRLLELLLQLAGSRGLDRSGVLFRELDEYLSLAGLVEVQRRDVDAPLGHGRSWSWETWTACARPCNRDRQRQVS